MSPVADHPHPPSAVAELVSGEWVAVEPTSPGPGAVWLTDEHAIKAMPLAQAAMLDREAANAEWLAPSVGVASPLLRSDDHGMAWLVSKRLDGVPAHRPDLHGDVGSLAEVAGNALRELHALPLDDAPASLERGWEALAATATEHVAGGLHEVDEPYQRYSNDQLLELWRQGRPEAEDLVICHGDPALPNMMAKLGVFAGWVDLGGVRVADRHLDLAHAHASIHRNLGPEAVYVFYDAYGQDPELLRLDHYLLARQLLP